MTEATWGASGRRGARPATVLTAMVAIGLAACSSGEDPAPPNGTDSAAGETSEDAGTGNTEDTAETSGDDGASDTSQATEAAGGQVAQAQPMSDDQWWAESLCSQLDLSALGEATGVSGLERVLGNSYEVGVPATRDCAVANEEQAMGTTLTIGVSVAPVTEDYWAQITDAQSALLEQPAIEMQAVDVGDAAFVTPSLGKALVGDRVVTLDTMDASALTPEQLEAGLELVAQAVEAGGPGTAPAQQAIPECTQADEEAAALLGEEPTVRADFYHPAFEAPNCLWATRTGAVQVSARPVDDAAAEQQGQGYDQQVDLGGGGGLYLEDGSAMILSWASANNDYDVTMEFVDGQEVAPEDAVALGQALQGLYAGG